MKILFIQDVPGIAYAGDIKTVKNGFGRNYLLPRNLAVLATRDQLNRVEGLQAAASKRRDVTETEMSALAQTLEGATVTIEARAGVNDRLYGSITNLQVAEELSKLAGREIDRRRVVLEPIHQLGTYEVPVKLHPGIEAIVTVVVTAPGREAQPPAAPPEEPQAALAEEPASEAIPEGEPPDAEKEEPSESP